jgi:hypothetical protein
VARISIETTLVLKLAGARKAEIINKYREPTYGDAFRLGVERGVQEYESMLSKIVAELEAQ